MSEPGGRTSESLTFTRDTSRAVDRLALDEFAMPSILLMENAARSATEAAIEALGGRLGPVLIVAGPGNNGGDGFAMARHLHNAGCPVSIVLLSEPKAGTDAAVNLEIARRMRLPIAAEIASTVVSLPGPPALVVDAIFGTGLASRCE